MNDLIEIIRAATTDGATDEQKRAAATACRHLATAFDTQPGRPLAPPAPPSPLAMLGQLNIDQVLDLAIAKLRAKLGDEAPATATSGFRPPQLILPRGGGG